MKISKLVSKTIGEKKQWRQYKARVAALPPDYRNAADAVEHYLLRVGAIYVGGSDSAGLVAMFDDLADLFEQSAASGTPIRDIIGADPVAFVEDFVSSYPSGQWLVKERTRLNDAITHAAGETS